MYSPNLKTFTIDNFTGGINMTDYSEHILDHQMARCENMRYIGNKLTLRPGIKVNLSSGYTTSWGPLSSGYFNVFNAFETPEDGDPLVVTKSNVIYSVTGVRYATATVTTLYSPFMAVSSWPQKARCFYFGDKIYLLGGGYYCYVDYSHYRTSGVVSAGAVTAYVPTHYINKSPDKTSGALFDELNYLTSSFKETFNGNGVATAFHMTYTSLTTGDNIVVVNNTTLTSGAATAGFTVNYVSGYFTLTTAPTTGIGNVEITTRAAILEASCVLNCTFARTFGATDGLVYFSGNSSFPNRIFWSDIGDASYFPATSYANVGIANDPVMQFAPYGSNLLILKKKTIHMQIGEPPDNSISQIYEGDGCVATDSLQILDNGPIWFADQGVVQLSSDGTLYSLELISRDVNGRLDAVGQNYDSGILDYLKYIGYTPDEMMQSVLYGGNYILIQTERWERSYFWVYDPRLKHRSGGRTIYPWMRWHLSEGCNSYTEGAVNGENWFYSDTEGYFCLFSETQTNDVLTKGNFKVKILFKRYTLDSPTASKFIKSVGYHLITPFREENYVEKPPPNMVIDVVPYVGQIYVASLLSYHVFGGVTSTTVYINQCLTLRDIYNISAVTFSNPLDETAIPSRVQHRIDTARNATGIQSNVYADVFVNTRDTRIQPYFNVVTCYSTSGETFILESVKIKYMDTNANIQKADRIDPYSGNV